MGAAGNSFFEDRPDALYYSRIGDQRVIFRLLLTRTIDYDSTDFFLGILRAFAWNKTTNVEYTASQAILSTP